MRTKESFRYSSKGPYLSVLTFDRRPNHKNTSNGRSKELQALQDNFYAKEDLEKEEWNNNVLLDRISFHAGFYESLENSMCSWTSVDSEFEDAKMSHLLAKQNENSSIESAVKPAEPNSKIDDYLFEFQLPRYNFKPACYSFVEQTH